MSNYRGDGGSPSEFEQFFALLVGLLLACDVTIGAGTIRKGEK